MDMRQDAGESGQQAGHDVFAVAWDTGRDAYRLGLVRGFTDTVYTHVTEHARAYVEDNP